MNGPGYNRLWGWFGMSYASWLTVPRVLMHEMPDDWQERMAQLMSEYDEAFPGKDTDRLPSPFVTAKRGRRFCAWPSWLLNYRHPDIDAINELRKP